MHSSEKNFSSFDTNSTGTCLSQSKQYFLSLINPNNLSQYRLLNLMERNGYFASNNIESNKNESKNLMMKNIFAKKYKNNKIGLKYKQNEDASFNSDKMNNIFINHNSKNKNHLRDDYQINEFVKGEINENLISKKMNNSLESRQLINNLLRNQKNKIKEIKSKINDNFSGISFSSSSSFEKNNKQFCTPSSSNSIELNCNNQNDNSQDWNTKQIYIEYNNNYNEDNNNVNLLRKINYLNKDLEEKNKKINNLQEKLKNLMNQLNTFKNNKEDLMNNNTLLEQEVNQLNIKINQLENINFNKDQQIIDLSNLNNKLSIQVNDVHNSNCQQIYNNNDLNHNEELEQKICRLERKNEELQKKLMNNLNNGKKNNNINKILHEKDNLLKENFNLKEEILSLKNSINLKLQRIDELERELEEAKNECEINLNELKLKQNKIQKLSNIIEKKEKEIKFESNYKERESGSLCIGDKNNIPLSQEIEEKNKKIVNFQKEINNYKSKNNKLFLENSSLKEKLEIIQNEHDKTLDKFKNELNDKSLQIQKLTKENNYLKNSANNNYEVEREIDLNNIKNENNSLRNIVNSTRINDSNRIKFLKDELEEYIIINESHRIQIKTLKEEIKLMKDKIKDLETFGGKMKNIDEFFSLLNQALYNYMPKKKEQKEALNKIMEVLNNSQKQK